MGAAYVGSQQQGALVVLDLVRWVEVARLALDRTPRALDMSPDGKWLYFTVAGDDAVQVLDTATNRVGRRIPVGASRITRHSHRTAAGLWCRARAPANSASSTWPPGR